MTLKVLLAWICLCLAERLITFSDRLAPMGPPPPTPQPQEPPHRYTPTLFEEAAADVVERYGVRLSLVEQEAAVTDQPLGSC